MDFPLFGTLRRRRAFSICAPRSRSLAARLPVRYGQVLGQASTHQWPLSAQATSSTIESDDVGTQQYAGEQLSEPGQMVKCAPNESPSGHWVT